MAISKRLAFFQSDLNVGGIQRALIDLCSLMVKMGHEVDLFIFDNQGPMKKFLPKEVRLVNLPNHHKFARFIPFSGLYHLEKQYVKKQYDISIDFNSYWNICAVQALKTKAKKHFIWVHTDLQKKIDNEPRYALSWKLSKSKFQHFDEIICVSKEVEKSLTHLIGTSSTRTIPNYIDIERIQEQSKQEIDFEVDYSNINFVSMSRLIASKDMKRLIQEYYKVYVQRKNTQLYLIGSGPELENLKNLVSELNLQSSVHFLGEISNPYPYLRKMDCFVFASKYEGQGIVIKEARALNLPVLMIKSLEKEDLNITGVEDLASAMLHFEKSKEQNDGFDNYNEKIQNKLINLIGENY